MKHDAFIARQKRITLDGVAHKPMDIAYTNLGDGSPLILMHGIPTWSFLYHDVIDRLAETHRVIAPDFVGHGMSDQRDQFDRSSRAQRGMIFSLIIKLDVSSVTLIGHDTGGGVALIMAIENPECVDKPMLSNIVAYGSWPIDDMISVGYPDWARKPNAEIREFLIGGFDDGLSRTERLTEEWLRAVLDFLR